MVSRTVNEKGLSRKKNLERKRSAGWAATPISQITRSDWVASQMKVLVINQFKL
eukprot:IDg4244t1